MEDNNNIFTLNRIFRLPPNGKSITASEIIKRYCELFPGNRKLDILNEIFSKYFTLQSPVSGINYDGTQIIAGPPGTPTSIELWKHQYDTVIRAMMELIMGGNGCIFGDTVGAGKTYQLLSIFAWLLQLNAVTTLVLIVPQNVIPDWKLALEKYGFSSFVIDSFKNIVKLYNSDFTPPIVIIDANIRETHDEMFFELSQLWLKLFSSNDSIYAGDEEEDAESKSWLHRLWKNSPGFKAILSGTIVTTTFYDIVQHLGKCAAQRPDFSWIMQRNVGPAFYGPRNVLLENPPYLSLLEVWSNLERYLHLRMKDQLGITSIPSAELSYVGFPRSVSQTSTLATTPVRPYQFFTASGVNADSLDSRQQQDFRRKNQENIAQKIDYLLKTISSHKTENSAKLFSLLLVFSSIENIKRFETEFKKRLEQENQSSKYILIKIPGNDNFIKQAEEVKSRNEIFFFFDFRKFRRRL